MNEHLFDDRDFYLSVGNKIRVMRNEKGIDQETFAKKINLTRTSVINIEKGRQRPSLHQIWLMVQFLNISFVDLLPPPDLSSKIDIWKQKVEQKIDSHDDVKLQVILNFISATLTNK